jgi:tRNA(Arg) A34 adenosine deaminase TadA
LELGVQRIPDHDLYVTLEPCPMCAAAIANARIDKVIFGAYDPKSGGVEHGPKIFSHPQCHHKPEIIGGVMEVECGDLLKTFFSSKRHFEE